MSNVRGGGVFGERERKLVRKKKTLLLMVLPVFRNKAITTQAALTTKKVGFCIRTKRGPHSRPNAFFFTPTL